MYNMTTFANTVALTSVAIKVKKYLLCMPYPRATDAHHHLQLPLQDEQTR
ncbi:hypothetical protein PRUB_a1089 [Pseudoalteromonas rubra]|uniref:Uncharacterized protein n=1 Tax=Pseudoalteromonas rubra TaxID=43658 RepID=A0A8T0C7B0_9GAMM|nr:hypothetical protein PRUB_a1089 [Pseudoalteromonas rubra]